MIAIEIGWKMLSQILKSRSNFVKMFIKNIYNSKDFLNISFKNSIIEYTTLSYFLCMKHECFENIDVFTIDIWKLIKLYLFF